jgi:formylmethanofuran dehydrogenase subunit E
VVGVKSLLLLESVWSVLSEGKWESTQRLSDACGLDEDTTKKVLNFLIHWNFAEAQISPDLRVRRKADAMDPITTVKILHSFTAKKNEVVIPEPHVIAERVTCRVCGAPNLRQVDENEVECAKCMEKQWLTLSSMGLSNGSDMGW